MKTLLTLGSLSLGLSLAAANVDKNAYDAYLTADDPGTGPFSFNSAGNWNPSGAPAAGKNYLVQGESTRRFIRANSGSTSPFLGASITLDNGEIRIGGNSPRVDNLIVYDGMIQDGTSAKPEVGFGGAIHIQRNGVLHLNGSWKRLLNLTATIDGDESTTIKVDAAQTTHDGCSPFPYWAVLLAADNSGYRGAIDVKGLRAQDPSALIAQSAASLGTGQTITFGGNTSFFGAGADIAGKTFAANANFVVGGYANGRTGFGLRLGTGTTVSGSDDLIVTNMEGVATVFGGVSFNGFTRMVVRSAGVQFDPDYTSGLPIVSDHVLTVRFDGDPSTHCRLPAVALSEGMQIHLAYTGNTLDLATNKNDVTNFSYPVLEMPGLGETLSVDDFILENGDVPDAALVIRGGVLYFERTETAKYVYVKGWAGSSTTSGNCWTQASVTENNRTWGWSDGAKPSSDKNYLVPSNQSLRARVDTVFPGKTLSILACGSVSYSDKSIFNAGEHLRGYAGGMLLQRTTGSIRTVKGRIELPSSSAERAFSFVTEGPNGTTVPRMTVEALLSGGGNIDFHGVNGGNVTTTDFHPLFADSSTGDRTRGQAEFIFTGDNSAFTGGISMQSTRGSLTYTTPQSLGGDPARFLKGGLTVAGGTKLVIQADISCGATRGVCFDLPYSAHPDATFEIAEGKTLTLAGAACGAANLVKTGTGTLVLNGASAATGQTRLETGTLALGAPTALGANNLVVAAGTTLRLDCAGVIVGGEIPFVQANGEAVASVNVSVPALNDPNVRQVELFVLKDVTAFDCTKLQIANVSAAACTFLTEQQDDGLHVSVKRMSGCVLIFR